MKKINLRAWAFVAVCFFAFTASAQYATDFRVTEVEDEELSGNIDMAVSGLLTAFNNAQGNGTTPAISGLDIADDVRENIMKLWKDCPFRLKE